MQVNYELFGPESRYTEALEYNQAAWNFPGAALTASSFRMYFNLIPPIIHASFLVVWWPLSNAYLRFVDFEDGPGVLHGLGTLHLPDSVNPSPQRLDVTAAMQTLQQSGVMRNIGYQLWGHCKVGVSRLEVVYGT